MSKLKVVTHLEADKVYMETRGEMAISSDTIHLVGFRFDGTACFRKGTRHGPSAIREVSDGIEDYSPYLDRTLGDRSIVDLGNLPSQDDWAVSTEAYFKLMEGIELEKNKVRMVVLGGEHSISYAPIKTYLDQYPDLVLIHLDAHADLRDGYQGHHYSHASIIRRVLDHFGPGHSLIQYGIRSGTQEEYQWMKENNTIARSREEFFARVNDIPPQRPIYLTLDLDYFDPSYFPGTGTPEPGGEDFHSFVKLMKVLIGKNFVGADITELSPPIDATGNSDCFATKVVREILLSLRTGDQHQ